MKIVLVAQNSSYTHTNAAVRILASCLAEKGHNAVIIETTVNEKGGHVALAEKLLQESADIYAFSVYIWNRQQQLATASVLKKLLPSCLIVFGGPEVSFDGDFFVKYPFADYLITGEGEQAICDIADGKYPLRTIVDAGNFCGFCDSDEPYFSAKASFGAEDGKLVYYESSRGCPYNCSYCLSSVKKQGEKVRKKSVAKTVSEVARLMSHKIRSIKFVDRTFNADISRAKQLFMHFTELSKEYTTDNVYKGPNLHFEICAALLDDETVDILKRAPKGLFRFEIGVQTVTPEALFAIGRADNTEKILENIDKLRKYTDVEVHLDLICGLPLDTYDGIKRSFDIIYGKCDMLQLGILKLLPGTRLRAEAEKYSISFLDEPPYTVLCTSSMSFQELRRLCRIADTVEHFSDASGGFYNSVCYLASRSESPFSMFEGMSEYFDALGNIAHKKEYAELLNFARKKTALDANETELLREYLRYDFIMSNQGLPPSEIQSVYSDGMRAVLQEEKRSFLRSDRENENPLFVPATEAHVFGFDPENVYIIDRKNRVCIKKKR